MVIKSIKLMVLFPQHPLISENGFKFMLAICIRIGLYNPDIRSSGCVSALTNDLKAFDEMTSPVFVVDKILFLTTIALSSRGR